MTARQQLDSFIGKYSPEVATLAREAFQWMRGRFPAATIMVYDNYNALVIGFGPTERASDAIFSIALYPRWVNLYLLWGALLPDPHKRLKGSGKQVRHIRLQSVDVLIEPAVLALIKEAAAESGMSSRKTPGPIVIKAIATRQRPRRALGGPPGRTPQAKVLPHNA
jgi:hypothetical protein